MQIEYYLDDSDDYTNYPRFRTTEATVISARMHRILPATSEIDDKFLPVFTFEKVVERAYKRGYVNVNKRYHAYFNGKTETYKTYITFTKALEKELIKSRVENPLTKYTYEPSYERFSIILNELFFKDETERIESVIKKHTEKQCEGARSDISNMQSEIWRAKGKISNLKEEIAQLETNPLPFLSRDLNDSFLAVKAKIQKREENLPALTELRQRYYAILAEHKKLSAKRAETCHTILYATDEQYRALIAQEQSLEELACKLIENSKGKIEAMIKEREAEIRALEMDIAESERELGKREEEYQQLYNKIYSEIAEQMKKSIIAV